MLPFQFLDIAEGLMHIDPVRTYPQRGAALVAKLADAKGFRLEPADGSPSITSDPPPADGATSVSLPLRAGKQTLGTLHLLLSHDASRLGAAELRTARWGARILARGMLYANRLAGEDAGAAPRTSSPLWPALRSRRASATSCSCSFPGLPRATSHSAPRSPSRR